ncbi:hypothetical protein D3C73_1475340 [compost metagenome]
MALFISRSNATVTEKLPEIFRLCGIARFRISPFASSLVSRLLPIGVSLMLTVTSERPKSRFSA